MKYCLLLLPLLVVADDSVEVANCQNGVIGQLFVGEVPTVVLSGNAGFLRQSQCDSKIASTRVAPGTCNVSIVGAASTADPVTTPSTTTPVMSYLDAGPQLSLTGPVGELRMVRSIVGGTTSYGFNASRFSQAFLVPGKYEIKTEAGRDLPAWNLSFDYNPLAIASPVNNSTLSSANTPVVSWTGGSEAMVKDLEVQVRAASRDGRRAYDVRCRLGQSSSPGEFTVPKETWELVPADVRSAGFASVVITHAGLVTTLGADGLEGGLQVIFAQYPGVGLQLIP